MFGNGIALVTGAAGGLGRATAVMLANRGMKVAFADMLFEKFGLMAETASLLRESHDVLFQPVDVTDSESVIALLDRTERHFGEPPSLVVHCAGITASQPVGFPTLFDLVVREVLEGSALAGPLRSSDERERERHVQPLASGGAAHAVAGAGRERAARVNHHHLQVTLPPSFSSA